MSDHVIRTLGVLPVGAAGQIVVQRPGSRTMLIRALHALSACTDRVVVVVEPPLSGLVRDALALHAPGAQVLDVDPVLGPAADLTAADRFVVHDARCPLLTAAAIGRVMSVGTDAAVGVRVVTDTVKTVTPLPREPGAVGPALARVTGTLDREAYRAVSSPLVLSPVAVDLLAADLGPAWWLADLWQLVPVLRRQVAVELVDVGGLGHRVEDEANLYELDLR